MKIKSYYSRTVEEAMAAARQELGPDAMLVNTRKASPETRHLGEYEVVFATIEPDISSAPQNAVSPADRLSLEVSEMKKELEGMRRALTRTAYAPPEWAGVPQDVSDAYAALTAAEIAPQLAREIVQAAGARLASQRAPFQRALTEEIQSRFTTDSALGTSSGTPRMVALVGPPGSGKTSSLVKLAVNYGLAARRGVLLLSMDTHRIAAADQLRAYAAILGVGVQVPETVSALAQTIEENRGKELIFIDTPGLAGDELETEAPLMQFLASRSDIDVHLVLPASMKPADLARVVDAFSLAQPDHLLFTRLDETGSFGPILNEAVRAAKPLSFFSIGQRIPEDLEAATPARLLDLLIGAHQMKARSAA